MSLEKLFYYLRFKKNYHKKMRGSLQPAWSQEHKDKQGQKICLVSSSFANFLFVKSFILGWICLSRSFYFDMDKSCYSWPYLVQTSKKRKNVNFNHLEAILLASTNWLGCQNNLILPIANRKVKTFYWEIGLKIQSEIHKGIRLIYSEKATQFCKIFTLLLS